MAADGRISALADSPRTPQAVRSALSIDSDEVTNACANANASNEENHNTTLDDHVCAASATAIQCISSDPDLDDILLDDDVRLETASSLSSPLAFPSPAAQWRRLVMYAIFLGTFVAFACGAPLGWTAVGGAALMLLADCHAHDADATLALVDWPLLVFFAALFVAVAGFERTGVPARVWESAAPRTAMTAPGGVATFAVLVRYRICGFCACKMCDKIFS